MKINDRSNKPTGCLDIGYIGVNTTIRFHARGLFAVLYAPSNSGINLELYSSDGVYITSVIKYTDPECKISKSSSSYYSLTNTGGWYISFVIIGSEVHFW